MVQLSNATRMHATTTLSSPQLYTQFALDRVARSTTTIPLSKSKSSSHHPAAACRRRGRRKSSRSGLLLLLFFALAVYLLDLSASRGGSRRLRGGGGSVAAAAARSAARQAGISGDDVFLIDLDGGEATLAAHRHDLSFAGFANRSGHWHVFRGDEGAIPNACRRRLPFRNTYRDLIDPSLPLGRAAAAEATEAIASYDADAAGEEEAAAAALRRGVAAPVGDARGSHMRLKPIGETRVERVAGERRGACVAAAEHLPYIEHWDTMSSSGGGARGGGTGPFTELLRRRAGIRSAGEALAIDSLERLGEVGVQADRLIDLAMHFQAAFFLYFLLDLGGYRSDVLSVSDLEPPSDGLTGGLDADELAAVALQGHDLSLADFANRTRHWHAFRGREGLVPSAASVLPFGGDTYRDLIGGIRNLPGVPLGRAAMVRAARVLSSYDPAAFAAEGNEVEELGRALAAVTVMISEAARVKPINETVSSRWWGEARVAAEHLPYIEHWDTMSFELLRFRRTGRWDGPFTELLRKDAGIGGAEEAGAVAGVLIDRDLEELQLAHGI
uniref:rRNA N-glycosidase n=1 Tax=Oryza glumipatula TaxID=40148 RepID=A0A0D9ZBT3_9ORYZ